MGFKNESKLHGRVRATMILSIAADYARILKAEGQSPEQITARVNQVRNIKAILMPQIIIERYVVGKSGRYVGEKAEGGLRIITKGQRLLVLVREGLKQDVMTRLLRKEMTRLLQVSKHNDLLGDLLAADDPESLLEDLQRAGAHQVHLVDASAGAKTGASDEIESDGDSNSDAIGDSNFETALEKSTNVMIEGQRRFPASAEAMHNGNSDMGDAQRRLTDVRNGKRSQESSESIGYTVCSERISPMPTATTTTLPACSTPVRMRGSLLKRGLGSADSSSVDLLTSALAKVTVADDGLDTAISQDPSRFTGSATKIEDASPATRTPRLKTSMGEQNSLSPWQNLHDTSRHRQSGSQSQPLNLSAQVWHGSLQHLHQRPRTGSPSSLQSGHSSERRKEIGRKGEHIVSLRGKLFWQS